MVEHIGADEAHGVVVRLEHRATQNAIVRSYGIMPSSRPEDDDLDRDAARLLRVQGEQLDTLRNAIGDPRLVENMYVQANCGSEVAGLLGFLRRIADAVDALAAAGGGVPEPMDEGDRVCSACSGSGVRHPASNPEACKVCAGSGVLDGGVPKKGATDE